MNLPIRSDEFSHLVGRAHPGDDERNYSILKAILRDRRIRHRADINEDNRTSVSVDLTKGLATEDLVVPTITCYCDIPLKHIAFHAEKYGRFGLSFSRMLLIERGARPVSYVPMTSHDFTGVKGRGLLRDIEAIYRSFREKQFDIHVTAPHRTRSVGKQPEHLLGLIDALDTLLTFYFIAYLKPFDAELPEDDANYFYSESEWRLTTFLQFTPKDVRTIFIPDDYQRRFLEEWPEYSDTNLVNIT